MTLHSTAVELRPRSIGEVIGLTFDLYRRNLPLFIGIAAVVVVPTMLLLSLGNLASLSAIAANPSAFIGNFGGGGLNLPSQATSPETAGSMMTASLGSTCLLLLTYVAGVFWPWMEGALSHNVIERVLGRAPGLRASYAETRPRFGALWGSNALAQLGIGALLFVGLILGSIVFGLVVGAAAAASADSSDGGGSIIPTILAVLCAPVLLAGFILAIVLSINWAFRAPVIVGEGVDGIGSLSRSNELAKGDRWRIFGRFLLFGLLIFVPIFLVVAVVTAIVVFATASSLLAGAAGDSARQVTAMLPVITATSVVSLGFNFVLALLLTPLFVIFTTVNYLDLRTRKENLAAAVLSANATAAALAATSAPVAVPIETPLPVLDTDVAKLPPGQRIGVFFNRLRAEGDSAKVLSDLGMAYSEVGDLSGALDALNRARALAPGDADIAFNLAMVYRNRKDLHSAKQMMSEYLRLETNADELAAVRNNPRYKDLID